MFDVILGVFIGARPVRGGQSEPTVEVRYGRGETGGTPGCDTVLSLMGY
jgi:hypothetical protein